MMHSKVDQLWGLASVAPILVHVPSQDPLLLPMPTASGKSFPSDCIKHVTRVTKNKASSTQNLQNSACLVRRADLVFQKFFNLITIRSRSTEFTVSIYLFREEFWLITGQSFCKGNNLARSDLGTNLTAAKKISQSIIAGHYAQMYQHSCRSWHTMSCHLCILRAVYILSPAFEKAHHDVWPLSV